MRVSHVLSNTLHRGANLLGIDLFDRLEFRIVEASSGLVVQSVRGLDRKAQWSDVFSGLGKVKGFSHFPMIDQTVTPVQQSLRRLPLALREDVSTEPKRILDEGIIEQIDTSRWLSNVVVVRKKSGDLCWTSGRSIGV